MLPVVETLRRWHQLGDLRVWPSWLDDWAIGAFLLFGAWQSRSGSARGRAVLAAAWGFACGLGYASFFSQIEDLSSADPSGFPSAVVAAIKGMMLTWGVVALVAAIRGATRPAEAGRAGQ
jgi:hypothetical protein